jgi:hypothetical protein
MLNYREEFVPETAFGGYCAYLGRLRWDCIQCYIWGVATHILAQPERFENSAFGLLYLLERNCDAGYSQFEPKTGAKATRFPQPQ